MVVVVGGGFCVAERKFLRAPFLKHRKVCQSVFGDGKKRAVFDSKQARLKVCAHL